jgi:hypothetical protein
MTTDDQAMRDFAKRLFSDPDQPAEPIAKPRGHVAGEGSNPSPPPTDPFHEFVADLFSNRD